MLPDTLRCWSMCWSGAEAETALRVTGMNQLLWYFAELERKRCYSLPNGLPNWDEHADSCTKWRSFAKYAQ